MTIKQRKKNSVKIKDIMRLFLQFETEFFPVMDARNNLRGLIYKDKLISDATDMSFLEKNFSSVFAKYTDYPEEKEFLEIVSLLNEENEFPVLNIKGEQIELWRKNNLINIYYKINSVTNSKQKKEIKTTPDVKAILDLLPINFIIIDEEKKIVYATPEFIKTFDFKIEILINQNVLKIFPDIKTIAQKKSEYSKQHTIYYQHKIWLYNIVNLSKYQKNHIGYIFFLSADNKNMRGNDLLDARKTKLPDILHNEEKSIIETTLKKNNWNISLTAKILKIPRQTLQYKINKYKIMINDKK